MSEELFLLDLSQVERVRRLKDRIDRGLQHWDDYTKAIALQEDLADLERAGMEDAPKAADSVKLREDQGRVLAVLKAAVWNASDGLRSDHQKRRAAQAAAAPVQEETQEE